MNKPYRILVGDVLDGLAQLADGSVHCAVTSPPYWGLRDYGCEGQIGLEPTPEAYVERMVGVFREVRRVMRQDGTLWLNVGDSYQNAKGQAGGIDPKQPARRHGLRPMDRPIAGLKPKDLVGVPWLLAFALRADGWVLRSEIIWAKANPMPESVTDRPTKSHEQVFLFSKARWRGPEGGRFSGISDQDARWLALLVDAEGCIVVKRTRHDGRGDTFAPQVSIGSISRALLTEVVRIVGHGTILERGGKNAAMWYWQLGNNIARDFLYRCYPYFIIKQRQARIGVYVDSLTYYRGGQKTERKQRTKKETNLLLSLWARNKECNHFGHPNLSDVPEPEYGRWDSQPYFYDAEAIKEGIAPATMNDEINGHLRRREGQLGGADKGNGRLAGEDPSRRNRRTVWEIPTQSFPGAHFATYPEALVEPCVKAGTSERGCCGVCGAPWERVTESERKPTRPGNGSKVYVDPEGSPYERHNGTVVGNRDPLRHCSVSRTTGWEASCRCGGATVPCTVLDPFLGSGTTLAVACRLGRAGVGCELNPIYAAMAEQRIDMALRPNTYRDMAKTDDAPLFAGTRTPPGGETE